MPRSRFLRRTALMMTSTSSIFAIILALVLVGALTLRRVDRPSNVRIAVGPADSVDAQFGEALHRELPKGFESASVQLVRAGSLEDIAAAVDDDKAQLAIVRTDVAMPKQAGTMLVVHRDAALFLALAESKIADIAGLDGHRIGIVPGDSANAALLDAVLARYGIEPAKVTRVPLKADALAAAVAKKEIDAVLTLAPLGSEALARVVETMTQEDKPPVFLAIKNADAFEQGASGFVKIDVPSGLFDGAPPQPEDDFQTIGVDYQLVARLDMSEAIVDVLTRTIFSLRRALEETAPIAAFMQAPDTEKGSRFPLHVGATAYYQDTEKSFMDRYGDWFYIIAMVMGGLGSAIASLIATLQARSRRAAMAVIDQLADMRHAVAKCADQAALREIDRQVSELALASLYRAREGRIDQAGVETLRLAIDETRRSITRRLADLRSAAPASSQAVTG